MFFKIWKSGAFFAFSPLHLSGPLRKQRVVVCDWWIWIRFVCFCVSRFVALFLKKNRKFTLKHGKFRFPRWDCSNRASKPRGNTDTEGWKRTGTFPSTFPFVDKHSGCYGNGLIDIAEKFEFGACSIWIVEDLGRGSFLFPTYLGRSKETLFAGERMHWRNFNLFNGNFRYPSTCTIFPSVFWDQWVQLWQKERDPKVRTEAFSYDRGNIVIIFHQFDLIECTYWYICGSTSLRKCPSCSFWMNDTFHAGIFTFLVMSITHNELIVASENRTTGGPFPSRGPNTAMFWEELIACNL